MRLKNKNNFKLDISELLEKFKEKYKNIYLFQFEDQVFIYHSIGRKEYTDLIMNQGISDPEKEEIICKMCTLYPKDFDFENCEEAGLPTNLAKEIIDNSYLSKENRKKVLAYFRSEMRNLDNQINCMILSAFPHLNLEEIENWDVITANKYLSRAEWILTNIGGVPLREQDTDSDYIYQQDRSETEDLDPDNWEQQKQIAKKMNGGQGNKKQKADAATLAKMKAKFPEIDWDHDNGLEGIDGIRNAPSYDSLPVALRPMSRVPQNVTPPPYIEKE